MIHFSPSFRAGTGPLAMGRNRILGQYSLGRDRTLGPGPGPDPWPWAGTGILASIPWAGTGPLAGIPYPCIPYTRLRGADSTDICVCILDDVIDDWLSVVTNHPFLRPICPYIFVLAYFSGYLVSMDQVSMGICGPGIGGPGIYGPGI